MASSAELYAPLKCACGGEVRLACANGCDDPELERRGGPMAPPMPTRRLDRELAKARDDEIVRRYQAGEELATVGRTFGISGERCRQILSARGVDRRKRGP